VNLTARARVQRVTRGRGYGLQSKRGRFIFHLFFLKNNAMSGGEHRVDDKEDNKDFSKKFSLHKAKSLSWDRIPPCLIIFAWGTRRDFVLPHHQHFLFPFSDNNSMSSLAKYPSNLNSFILFFTFCVFYMGRWPFKHI
jgi:hypothetical protein